MFNIPTLTSFAITKRRNQSAQCMQFMAREHEIIFVALPLMEAINHRDKVSLVRSSLRSRSFGAVRILPVATSSLVLMEESRIEVWLHALEAASAYEIGVWSVCSSAQDAYSRGAGGVLHLGNFQW